MHLGMLIKKFRDTHDLSMADFAKLSNISKAYVSVLEKNKDPRNGNPIVPSLTTIEKVANGMGMTFDDVFNQLGDDEIVTIDNSKENDVINKLNDIFVQLTPPRQTKVYDFAEYQLDEQNDNHTLNEESVIYLRSSNQSAAGMMIDPDNPEEFDVLPSEMVPRGADEIVEIMGESMEPLIKKGERVFLRHQPTVENGEIAIVRIEDEGVTCKRFYLKEDTVILKSENDRYEDMMFNPSQVTILGKVLK